MRSACLQMGDIYSLLKLSIAVWVFDRIVRLMRIAYMSVSFSRQTAPRAEVSLAAPNVLAIKVYTARSIQASAGEYINICFPTLQPWTVHPFSVIKTEGGSRCCVHFAAKVHAGITKQLAKRVSRAPGGVWSGVALLEGPYGQAIKVSPHVEGQSRGATVLKFPFLAALARRTPFPSSGRDGHHSMPIRPTEAELFAPCRR
jgi:FAD-binding domain